MTIRFTHTEKWEDAWFRKSPPLVKLLYLYIIDKCDIAGIWEKDLELAAFVIGADIGAIQGAYEQLSDKLISLDETHNLARNFIKRQRNYPLNPENAAHAAIINRLLAYRTNLFVKNLLNTPEIKGLTRGYTSPISISISISKGKSVSKSKSNITFSFEEKKFIGITDDDISRWSEAYPAVDISGEIRRAAEWLLSNPDKRKSRYRRFLINWFSRTQEKGGSSGRGATDRPDNNKPRYR